MHTDFDPGATKRALTREGLALVAQGLLYGFGFLRPRHRAERRKDIRTVVLLHGLGANRASLFPMQAYLRLLGHDRQYSFNTRIGRSIEEMAIAVKRRLDEDVK